MIKPDTSKRSNKSEIMDDFELKGAELEKTLNDLDNINKWLGGNKITLNGIQKLLEKQSQKEEIIIIDIGCGNGAMLRKVAAWAKKNNRKVSLIGVDANSYAIEIAEKLSKNQENISFRCINIFSPEFKNLEFDVALVTLTLHHFKTSEIIDFLNTIYERANIGIVINDLQRNKLAYHLFRAFCAVFINNEIARKDGLTSILRGFRKNELEEITQELPAKNNEIHWKWAFRYQWLIQKQD